VDKAYYLDLAYRACASNRIDRVAQAVGALSVTPPDRGRHDTTRATKGFQALAEGTVVRRQVIDARPGYALYSLQTESGRPRHLLQAYSKHQGEGCFYVYSVFTDAAADWPAYYPLIRAMVANWVDLDGRSLGPPLPESDGLREEGNGGWSDEPWLRCPVSCTGPRDHHGLTNSATS
jgi:hypothetical protein